MTPCAEQRRRADYPKAERVRRRADFRRIQRFGRRVKARHFIVVSLKTRTPNKPTRFGVTASKRIGHAPNRSRAKRLLRALYRLNKDRFRPGRDYVAIALAGIERTDLATLTTELDRLCRGKDGRLPI